MANPIVISIPHRLGQAEAQRRLEAALQKATQDIGRHFSEHEVKWSGNHADLRVVALMQTVRAGIDVLDDSARLELQLPWYFAPLHQKIVDMATKRGENALKQIGSNVG